jgi:hypothetical protein
LGTKKIIIEAHGSPRRTAMLWAKITGVRLRLPHKNNPARMSPITTLKIKAKMLNPAQTV